MEKKTLISIIICFVLVFALTFIRTMNNDGNQSNPTQVTQENVAETLPAKTMFSFENTSGAKRQTFGYQTNVFDIVFDTKGASVKSMKLKNHANADGQFVDVIFNGKETQNAFMMYWSDNLNNPIDDCFNYTIQGNKVIFKSSYKDASGKDFTIVKTYEFRESDYLIAVNVKVEGSSFKTGEYAYTLSYGPQVGPEFEKMSSRSAYDYRRFYIGLVSDKGKVSRKTITLNKDGSWFTTKDLNWISVTSKYFTVVARPANTNVNYKFQAVQSKAPTIVQTNSIYLSVPNSEKADNTVYFYCGPQLKKYLGSYYNGTDNAWGLRELNLDDAMESGSALGWLESILKWCLQVLNKIIPNYGLDIIVLTIILKFVLWPLQKKSTESTAKMGTITNEVNAIKEKYPNNTQKQNEEMQKLYKEKGINPMGGCLPMLIQFPILIAFYGLLNRHFELRGAMFIPGWISDLSVPETIATLPFNIPLLGNQIHLLPIIYTASMIFSMKYTQSSTQNNGNQQNSMWFMTWGMPIMFFFILYSAPSGLLLYWTTQNALSILQQLNTNNKIKKYGPDVFSKKKKDGTEKKEPAAVIKYQEKLKKLAEAQNEKNKKGTK